MNLTTISDVFLTQQCKIFKKCRKYFESFTFNTTFYDLLIYCEQLAMEALQLCAVFTYIILNTS